MKKKTLFVALASLLLAHASANAAIFSNANDGGEIHYFGSPDTTNYGQTFTLGSAGILNDWSFFAASGSAGNIDLVVAKWDGAKAVGPALYTSADFSYAGGAQTLTYSNIALNLSAGSYIAYITTAGVNAPATTVALAGSNSDGGLAGGFRYLNTSGADPLTSGYSANPWSSWHVANMQFSANVAAVPEPESYAMLLAGLGIMGSIARRRKQK